MEDADLLTRFMDTAPEGSRRSRTPEDVVPPAPPAGTIPLQGVVVTVRQGGATVWNTPAPDAEALGDLIGGTQQNVEAVLFAERTWLSAPWSGGVTGWIDAEDTDFYRSRAYNQVVDRWYESEGVLGFRRALVRDLLRLRGADPEQVSRVGAMRGDALQQFEDNLTRKTIPPDALRFRELSEHLGLPAPFEYLPVHPMPPASVEALEFQGFGPTTFAFEQWALYYEHTRGMNPGVDFYVPEGTPLIAVADGVIVDFQFLPSAADRSLALRPYLPEQFRASDGSRVLSNVIVGYGHLTGDPTTELVRVGDEVRAGQIIGTSGWPVVEREDGTVLVQGNNAHLHVQVHLVTDGEYRLGRNMPFNPLLFWSPRLVAFQARLAAHSQTAPYPTSGQPWGRLGFFSIGCFRLDVPGIVWEYEPEAEQQWPDGVYDMEAMIATLQAFKPYPASGGGAF